MSGRGGGRAALVAVAVLGALLLVGALTADPRTGEPYDPASTAPDGTRALVELLEGFGAEVEVAASFPVDADVVVAFEDVVPEARHDDVRRWVSEGNTLVMADASSELAPLADFGLGSTDPVIDAGRCEIDALDGVGAIDLGDDGTDVRYLPAPELSMCFADEDGFAYAVLAGEGSGRVLSLVDGRAFTNANLGRADNAVLATAVLAPRPGTRVAVLTRASFPGESEEPGSLTDTFGVYLRGGRRLMVIQLGVALAVLGLAAGRRLGRPVTEPLPVSIASSGLVSAMGHLLQRRRDPAPAAALLRADLRRTVAERSGLSPNAPPAVLADAAAARSGRQPAELLGVLDDRPVGDDRELVALAQQIDVVREEVLHGRTP